MSAMSTPLIDEIDVRSRNSLVLAAAIAYEARGFSVIPIDNDKRAAVRWMAYQSKRATPVEINGWWGPGAPYEGFNVGIVTGKVSGLVVLDIDGPEGEAAVAEFAMPDTAQVRTARGRHLYFAHPGEGNVPNFAGRLKGVDLRGDGGYVVAPPSVHGSGHVYAWDDAFDDAAVPAFADLPQWLLTLADAPGVPEKAAMASADGLVHEGGRNDHLARTTGSYIAQGISGEALLMLVRGVNASTCVPPLPDTEVQQIVTSIQKAEAMKQPGFDRLNDPDLPADERRSILRQMASGRLGVSVERVVKYLSSPPTYSLTINGQAVDLGSDGILDHRRFSRAYAFALDRHLKVPKSEWMPLSDLLMGAAEHVDVAEGSERGLLSSYLDDYLDEYPPDGEDRMAYAVAEGAPFVRDGLLYINSTHLRQFIVNSRSDRIDSRELPLMLSRAGWEAKAMNARLEGKALNRSYWRKRAPKKGQA